MLFGQNSFGNGPNGLGFDGQNAPNISNHGHKAILFVFKPYARQFGDVAMRPFQYQFDDNFVMKAQQAADMSAKGNGGPSSNVINNLMAQQNLSDLMTTAFDPTMVFHGSNLDDKYRFILVFTQSEQGLINANTVVSSLGSSQIRRIYTGYLMDEPYNPATLSDISQTLNPNATLVITHKTIVGTSTQMEAYGPQVRINTRASEEVTNTAVTNSLISHAGRDNGLHLMTPSHCINTIETTSEGYALAVPGSSGDLRLDQGIQSFNSTFEQPTHHVAQIVRGMMTFQENEASRGRLNTRQSLSGFDEHFEPNEYRRMDLAQYMEIPIESNHSMFDLDLNENISVATIDAMVNHDLKVQTFNPNRPSMYDTADQMQRNMTNQYSHLIAMVVPAILSSAGLNDMKFICEMFRSQGRIQPPNFVTVGASPQWVIPHDELMRIVKAVELELINGILSTIFASMGDYRVEVECNTTGETIVRLNLVEQGLRCTEDFVMPSSLGGLISPMIGDTRNYTGNAEMMTGLYAAATGQKIEKGGLSEQDEDWMQFSSSHYGRSPNSDSLLPDNRQ